MAFFPEQTKIHSATRSVSEWGWWWIGDEQTKLEPNPNGCHLHDFGGLEIPCEVFVLLFVVEQSELTQFVLEQSEAGNFGDWQPVTDMREQRSHIGRGGAFLASWNRPAHFKSLASRFRQFGDFNPSIGSHRSRIAPKPKEDRRLVQACPGVDMNMQISPLIS